MHVWPSWKQSFGHGGGTSCSAERNRITSTTWYCRTSGARMKACGVGKSAVLMAMSADGAIWSTFSADSSHAFVTGQPIRRTYSSLGVGISIGLRVVKANGVNLGARVGTSAEISWQLCSLLNQFAIMCSVAISWYLPKHPEVKRTHSKRAQHNPYIEHQQRLDRV